MRRSEMHCASLGRLALVAGMLVAATPAAAADGRTLYAKCAACHGARGEGVAATGAPPIAGLDAAYLERQLSAFAGGSRGARAGDTFGAAMRASSTTLLGSDADRKAVAAFVATLPPPPPGPSVVTNDNGRNYFNAICGACHGGKGQGNAALGAPRLAGQPAAYLARQLTAFGSGARGAQPGDRYGAQMRAVLGMLPDAAATRDVVAYASSLHP
jgi:cytochrome c oxidase subunit 2